MKFEFEIPDDEFFEDYYHNEFTDRIKDGVIDALATSIYNECEIDTIYKYLRESLLNLLKSKEDYILETAISRVVEEISKKKALKELTPKVSELVVIDKENEKYFEQLIDKVIKKKFK